VVDQEVDEEKVVDDEVKVDKVACRLLRAMFHPGCDEEAIVVVIDEVPCRLYTRCFTHTVTRRWWWMRCHIDSRMRHFTHAVIRRRWWRRWWWWRRWDIDSCVRRFTKVVNEEEVDEVAPHAMFHPRPRRERGSGGDGGG
jgi:hypothetical protein